jgi:multidrug resistance efflux pump
VQLPGSVPRQQKTADPTKRQPVDLSPLLKVPGKRPGRLARFARSTLKTVATLLILALALLAALIIWDFYVASPWTRDGSVRVQVANVAPQVSGQITEIRVVDNQFVHRGDVLYVIDPFDFQVALDTKKAERRQRAADVQETRPMYFALMRVCRRALAAGRLAREQAQMFFEHQSAAHPGAQSTARQTEL